MRVNTVFGVFEMQRAQLYYEGKVCVNGKTMFVSEAAKSKKTANALCMDICGFGYSRVVVGNLSTEKIEEITNKFLEDGYYDFNELGAVEVEDVYKTPEDSAYMRKGNLFFINPFNPTGEQDSVDEYECFE